MKREENKTFPGNGACELCGDTDPCIVCSGAQYAQVSTQVGDDLSFEPARFILEKVNSIFTSIIKK